MHANFNRRFLAVTLGTLVLATWAAHAAELPGVTTTTLPDPFPNCPPRVTDRQATMEMGRAGRTPSVLLGQYDVELNPLSVESFTQPKHGRAKLNPDGTFSYEPAPGYLGGDQFTFTLSDGRGGRGTASMRLRITQPGDQWATTCFTELAELRAGEGSVGSGKGAVVPRVVDWNGDGKLDLLVGAGGTVSIYRNVGTSEQAVFAAGVPLAAGGQPLDFAGTRVAIAVVDYDRDGQLDLIVTPASDRKPRWLRRVNGELAAPVGLRTVTGTELVAEDIRCDFADWNGDGLVDLVTGCGSGHIKICYQVAGKGFAPPVTALDSAGREVNGSYNLNPRICDVNLDGIPDFVETYNWGTLNFRINRGTAAKPDLPDSGTFAVAGPHGAALDLHALTDGPIVDFADLNGDGAVDLVMGCERGGRVHIAYGRSGAGYVKDLVLALTAHPADLGTYLADPAHATQQAALATLLGALYDYVANLATPTQRDQIRTDLAAVITAFPQYLRRQKLDLKAHPGIPSLAAQIWLTLLMTGPDDPAVRRQLAEVAGFDGGYRKMLEDCGVIYMENNQNPRGAEAIWQWLRTIPREVYPGTGITAADWLGGKQFLVRGHLKNTFNGEPVDGGEYGFGADARAVIGERGSENWFMTVVKHEVCHDVDAYVRSKPGLDRRWRQMLLRAGGPDLRADPQTGGLSWELTREHFKSAGLWDGDTAHWDAALKRFWETGPGRSWREFGFMRGGIDWFLAAPQESLATQGNQHWNSTEGRLQVAIERFRKGYPSNLGEVLLFIEIWSVGMDKVRFSENDNANNQIFSYAKVRRTAAGYIDRIDLADRYYEFAIGQDGAVTAIKHTPTR